MNQTLINVFCLVGILLGISFLWAGYIWRKLSEDSKKVYRGPIRELPKPKNYL